MLLILVISLRTTIVLSILLTINPATLSIWLILSAVTLSMTMSLSSSSWFGLILFLIYVGGILVIFSYFVAIQPNQRLEIKPPIIAAIFTTSALTELFTHQPKTLCSLPPTSPTSPFLLITPPSLIILFILATILFLALIAAVKISKRKEGPLRPFSQKYVTQYYPS